MSNLVEVERKFSKWRKSKNVHGSKEIPKELRKEVVELLSEYSNWELQKKLGLNSCSIKKWKEEYSCENFFISVPPIKASVCEKLELKFCISNTGNCSLEGNLSLNDWESAIKLLKGVSKCSI